MFRDLWTVSLDLKKAWSNHFLELEGGDDDELSEPLSVEGYSYTAPNSPIPREYPCDTITIVDKIEKIATTLSIHGAATNMETTTAPLQEVSKGYLDYYWTTKSAQDFFTLAYPMNRFLPPLACHWMFDVDPFMYLYHVKCLHDHLVIVYSYFPYPL